MAVEVKEKKQKQNKTNNLLVARKYICKPLVAIIEETKHRDKNPHKADPQLMGLYTTNVGFLVRKASCAIFHRNGVHN